MTTWRPVPGFEHILVTRDGRVKTAAYTVTRVSRWGTVDTYNWKERELKPRLSDNGYLRVAIQRNGVRGPLYVHRMIALAYVDGYLPGYHVNHIDGVKTHNAPENLEWVPLESNVQHAWRTGLTGRHGEAVWCAKLTPKKVRAIRRALAAGACVNTIAVLCDVTRETIKRIQDGRAWQSVYG